MSVLYAGEVFLSLRARPSLQKFLDRFHFLTRLCVLLDQSMSNSSNLMSETKTLNFVALKKTVVIYAAGCVDQLLSVDEVFLHEISKLQTVIVVSNCDFHKKHEFPGAAGVFTRANIGRDLAAHRDLISQNKESLAGKSLILLNSSCIWFAEELNSILIQIEHENFEGVTFMTNSHQRLYHFQSYFMYIPSTLSAQLIENGFFSNFKNWHFKRTIVELGEQRIPVYLEFLGVKAAVLFPVETLFPKVTSLEFVNPTIHGAGVLFGRKAPFIKKSALVVRQP